MRGKRRREKEARRGCYKVAGVARKGYGGVACQANARQLLKQDLFRQTQAVVN